MTEKRTFKIAPAVAMFVRPGLTSGEKLRGLEAAGGMSPVDQVSLLFCLMRDADERVKTAGTAVFSALSPELLLACIAVPDIHPAVLDAISRHHHGKPGVVTQLLACPGLSSEARGFLGRVSVGADPEMAVEAGVTRSEVDAEPAHDLEGQSDEGRTVVGQESDGAEDAGDNAGQEPDEEPVEEDEEHFSKYKLIQMMGIGEKIKMALTGDKEWRSILINDTNKLVSSSVIRNPRITDGEIIRILKVGVQNDEIVRLICDNREWVKNPLIRKALIDCPKTPLPNALRYLATLGDKEIAAYAKSKNISSVISTQAKRIVLAKKR